MNGIDPVASAISMGMAEKYEALLRCAITRALGHSDWTPESLNGRLSRIIQGSSEITALDDKPIFEVLPVEFTVDCTGHSSYARVSRKYRALI